MRTLILYRRSKSISLSGIILDQAIELYRATGDRLGEANTLLMLGRLTRKTGNTEQALSYLRQATESFKTIGATLGEANGYLLTGEVHFYGGEYGTAIELFQLALPLYERIDDRYSQAITWAQLAQSEVKLGNEKGALSAFEQVRNLFRSAGLADQAERCEQNIKTLSF